MNLVKQRPLLLPAVLSIGLWICGLVVINNFSDKIPHHPTDAQLLSWIQGNQNPITSGSWLWTLGCLSFLWFAALLRPRVAEAEDPEADREDGGNEKRTGFHRFDSFT